MLKFKNALLTTLVLSSSLSYAATTQTQSNDVGPWQLGAQALYLQPSLGGNGLGYSTFTNYGQDNFGNTIMVNGAPNNLHNINPNWGYGFALDAAYLIDAKNDFGLDWYHYNQTTSGYLPTGSLFAGSASGLYAGYQQVEPSWDAINFEVGHRFDFDTTKSIRVYAGAELARVKTQFTNYPRLTPTGTALFQTNDSITYTGFGPRFGADFDYGFANGFSVYAKGAGSLLAGTADQTVSGYQNYLGITFPYSTGNYNQTNHGVIIPEVEAKLGINYNYMVAQGMFGVDLGYMWVQYLNAMVSQVGAGVVSSSISTSSAANFDLNGLYLQVKWTGNF